MELDKKDKTSTPHLFYNQPKVVSLGDFAETDDERAVLSHWIHNMEAADTCYQEVAKGLVPEELFESLKKSNISTREHRGQQVLFPELFRVPFPPPADPSFTFIDLFAGIGGFRIAMQECGGKCVFSSEWDKAAQKTYFDNYGEVPFGDITRDWVKGLIPKQFDVLCAGFPCQPFSRAGVSARVANNQSHGFADKTQGTLFFDIMEIIRARRPLIVFLENVRNLVSHDKGKTFSIIKESIESEGYSFNYSIIDSSPLVPQKRVRCYMVCIRDGGKFKFPSIKGPPLPLSSILEDQPDESFTISDNLWAGHKRRTARNLERGAGFTAFTADVSKPANTLVARYYKDGKECLIPQEGENPRMLTPRECARLQGFPETFVMRGSKSDLYRQMGNSVAVPVIRSIGKEIKEQILVGGGGNEIRNRSERAV